METKTRNPILAAARPAASIALGAVLLAVAACGRNASPREPVAAPSLADRLEAMSPEAQLDTLQILTAAAPDNAELAFHTGNAWYTRALTLPVERGVESSAYLDSAVVAYERATLLDPDYSRAYVNMGLAYDAGRKGPEARVAFRKAIEINPNDVLAYCHLGFLEYTAGKHSDAMKLYERALAIDPQSTQAHYNLGLAFAEARIFREALREWERVAELDPDGELGKTAADNARIIRQYLEETP